jgi:hypothetical protein
MDREFEKTDIKRVEQLKKLPTLLYNLNQLQSNPIQAARQYD